MAGPQHLGRQFHEMTQDEFAQQPGTWFHGTVHGMIDPAGTGFHVGDKAAAEEVLRSRLVSSRLDHPNTYYSPDERDLRKVERDRLNAMPLHELAADVRRDPGYVGAIGHNFKYPAGHEQPMRVRVHTSDPQIVPGRITGPMENTPETAADDDKANNAAAEGSIQETNKGIYYENAHEGGMNYAVSAVLPIRKHFRTHEDYLVKARALGKKIPERAMQGYTEIPGQGRLF